MKFSKTSLEDAMLIDLRKFEDDRGFFARSFCAEEFAKAGLVSVFPQANYSYNVAKGTLRGMHYQKAPHAEVKVVRVVQGAMLDVIIDLRPDEPDLPEMGGLRAVGGELPRALRAGGLRPRLPDADATRSM